MTGMVLAVLIGLCVAVVAALALARAATLWRDYQQRLHEDTRQTLDGAFLFLDLTQVSPARLFALAGMLLVGAWILMGAWSLLPLVAAILLLPPWLLRHMRRRRRQQFDAQLPDFLVSLAGALRAGAGLQPAFQHIASQSRPPLSQEFALVLREQRLGLGLPQALQSLHTRMPTDSCGLMVSALLVASQTGGALAETLESVSRTLRSRLHWLGRVRALTAQGRMQSMLMASLPAGLLWVLSQLEPEAMRLLWHTWWGGTVLGIIVILECAGIVWIRRVATIDV
jgi:tight adherence protein B